MSYYTVREPIDVSSRHYSVQLPGINANYNYQAHPQGLFKTRNQWSVKGEIRVDLDEISDIQPYVVIQNPTPFGYLVKQKQYLTTTGQSGQPSSVVPRTYNYIEPVIRKSQYAIATSSSLPLAGPKYYSKEAIPVKGPIVTGNMGQSSVLRSIDKHRNDLFVPPPTYTFKRAAEAMVPENRPSKINKTFAGFVPQNQQKQAQDASRAELNVEVKAENVINELNVPNELGDMIQPDLN